jgi:hypothetical protein
MRKDSRLSFRISNNLSKRIDLSIDKSEGQIRDRSEFGTKAITFYLDYIENTQSETELMLQSIVSLAEHIGLDTKEIKYVRNILDSQTLLPSSISSNKTIDSHPKFSDLMDLREKFSEEIQKEISDKLRDASYSDVDIIYDEYEKNYYLEGTTPKPRKEKAIKN